MKNKLVMMICSLLTIGLAGCSNDSPLPNEIDNGIQGTTDEMVDFKLQNEDGVECYRFKRGDNIIFRLEIKNDTDEDAFLPRLYEIIGWDGFRVYSINGKDMGTPWDQVITNFLPFDWIGAHSSVVIQCPWFDIPELYSDGIEHCYSHMYYKTEKKLPLPKGEYYSEFGIKLNGKTIICRRNFIIM